MTHRSLRLVLLLLLPLAVACGWKRHDFPEYGVSMSLPRDAEIQTVNLGMGWGGMKVVVDGGTLWAGAAGGLKAGQDDVAVAARVLTGLGLGAESLGQVEEDVAGFTWRRVVATELEGRAVLGVYGVGPRGTYLAVGVGEPGAGPAVQRTARRWYRSLRVY